MNQSGRNLISTALYMIYWLAIAVIVIYFAKTYFSQPIFFLNHQMYKMANEQGSTIQYASNSGPDVVVLIEEPTRTVTIKRQKYTIEAVEYSSGTTKYTVTYPNDKQSEVNARSGRLLSRYELGGPFEINVNGQPVVGDRELYSAASLVTAAYSEYHTKRGYPFLFFLAFPIFIIGWCTYRYERFQDFLFVITLQGIWVRDADPSDFYYSVGRVRGIVIMIASVILMIFSIVHVGR